MNKKEKTRTSLQNKSIHKWLQLLADILNEHGLDQRKFLKPSIEIPWSKDSCKEMIYKPILEAYSKKKSTTEMTTKDIDAVFDIITKHIGEKWHLHIPFCSIENQIDWDKDNS
jgi:hypothetical protein